MIGNERKLIDGRFNEELRLCSNVCKEGRIDFIANANSDYSDVGVSNGLDGVGSDSHVLDSIGDQDEDAPSNWGLIQ